MRSITEMAPRGWTRDSNQQPSEGKFLSPSPADPVSGTSMRSNSGTSPGRNCHLRSPARVRSVASPTHFSKQLPAHSAGVRKCTGLLVSPRASVQTARRSLPIDPCGSTWRRARPQAASVAHIETPDPRYDRHGFIYTADSRTLRRSITEPCELADDFLSVSGGLPASN